MDDFSTPGLSNEFGLPPSKCNFIQPEKRPLSSSAPTLILDKEYNVKLAIGGSGGSIITTAVSQVIIRFFQKSFDTNVRLTIEAGEEPSYGTLSFSFRLDVAK